MTPENTTTLKSTLIKNGFAIVDQIYSPKETEKIIQAIASTDQSKDTFRKSGDLFAIRQFLKEVPACFPLIFNDQLLTLISTVFGETYFIVKSIYFDKPESSNWYVSYHQDLTISVDRKTEIQGFGPWTVKQQQFAVQPPVPYLENMFTIRIHLDDTTPENGALRVYPGSHQKKIIRPESIDHTVSKEHICQVGSGAIMIMKPLLLHSSGRTVNNQRRRVIHLEFSGMELPEGLAWSERLAVPEKQVS